MAEQLDGKVQALAGMFGELDLDVIRMVLEANQGSVDRAAEQLLQLQGDPSPRRQPPPQQQQQQVVSSIGNSFAEAPHMRRPTAIVMEMKQTPESRSLVLISAGEIPTDFLRPFSWFQSGEINPQLAQDALIAQQLQDQLFREGLMEARTNVVRGTTTQQPSSEVQKGRGKKETKRTRRQSEKKKKRKKKERERKRERKIKKEKKKKKKKKKKKEKKKKIEK